MLCRELLLKDVLPNGRRRALGRVDDIMHLVERMLAPEKRRVGRGVVKPWRYELCAEGFEDGIEGGGTFRTDGVPFLSYINKSKGEVGHRRGGVCETKTYADLLVDLRTLVLDAPCHACSELRESTGTA